MARKIEVALELDTGQFNRGLRDARNSLNSLGSTAGGAGARGMNVMGGAITGLVARLAPLVGGLFAIGKAINEVSNSLTAFRQIEDCRFSKVAIHKKDRGKSL